MEGLNCEKISEIIISENNPINEKEREIHVRTEDRLINPDDTESDINEIEGPVLNDTLLVLNNTLPILACFSQINSNPENVEKKENVLQKPSCSSDQMNDGSIDAIRSENDGIVSRLSSFSTPYASFSDHIRELVIEISIEKATNLQLGFMKKATIVNLIQTSILNIFEKLCTETKENSELLKTILKIFNDEYFEFITKHLNSILKRTKPLLDDYFSNETREMNHSFLKSLFFDSITIKNAMNFNLANEKKVKNNAAAILAHLLDIGTKETLQKAFAEYIYTSIERAVEQRAIIIAYVILYLFNFINYIIIVLEKEIRAQKFTKPPFLPALVSGILISNTQHVIRFLFDPRDRFERLFSMEAAFIMQSNEMRQKTQDPRNSADFLKKLTEKNPSQEPQKPSPSSSSTFFSSFFG